MRIAHRLPLIAALAPVIAAVAILISFHYFFLRAPGPIGSDDGYTLALGERLLDGRWLPYVDGASHRGPLLYWLAALAQATFGRFEWTGGRWLMFLNCLVTVAGLTGIGLVARAPLAGAIGALLYAYLVVTLDPGASSGVNGEPLAGCFAVLAILATACGMLRAEPGRRRLLWLGVAGCLSALGGFTKQTAFPLFAPLIAWVAIASLVEAGLTRRERGTQIAALLLGFAIPGLAIVLRYWRVGELHTFWYWFYTYNADVYMQPFADAPFREVFGTYVRANPWPFGIVCGAVALGLVRPVFEADPFPRGLPRSYVAHALEVTVALSTAAAYVAYASPKRFWFPYQMLVYPFLSLLLGLRAHALFERSTGGVVARASGYLVFGAMMVGWTGYGANQRLKELVSQRRSGGWRAARPDPMCELINQHTGAADPIYVWGFEADLYLTCRRHVAARFTYATLVVGTVPPFWTQPRPERVARDARRLLVSDLKATRPKLILDLPARMGNQSLRSVPELVTLIDHDYCRIELAAGLRKGTAYVRLDQPACTAR
ncbi:MAG: hypothetical protein KF718_03960 [Polyangiaceae bacterium]|nr:hypothetical protein [Polyangiaceae bacterium]